MGKSSKPTIGYWHQMTLYMGEFAGGADALRAVEWGGEMAWQGNMTTSGDIYIDQPELFGGETKEGGIQGTLTVRLGEPTQMPHPLLQQMRPGPWPAARGLVTTVFDGRVGALSPYVKTLRKLWSRWTAGWFTAVWQPSLCKIGEGMNPAHIIYQVLTDPDWGYGAAPGDIIDEPSFLKAAQTLHAEGFGLCLGWKTGEPVGNFISRVCEHVGGQWGERDNKIVLTLFRNDYDINELPLLDRSNIISLEEWDQPLLDGGVNEVTVVGVDAMTGKDIARTYQNLASIQAQGRVVSEKRQLPGLWNRDLLARVAARECQAASMLPCRIKVTVKGSAGPFVRGEVRAIAWPARGVERMAVRVHEVDEGTATDNRIGLTLTQDVVGMAQASYIAPVETDWARPDTTPYPLDPEALYEATYRDLVGFMRPADLALVGDEAGYLVSLGARPPGPAYNYALVTRVGSSGAFTQVSSGDFSPGGTLVGTLAIGDAPATITLNNHRGLSLVSVGEEIMVGIERGRVTAVNAGAGTVTFARGCVDTVPRTHSAGALVWFPDTFQGFDPTEYLEGETVQAKLLTQTISGRLAEGSATTRSLVMNGRHFRPYPPGRLRINGNAYPASVSGEVTISWAHRDRLLQADQLVDTQQGDLGPEPGTEYRVRLYSGTTLRRTAVVSGTSYTYTTANETADGGPFNPLRIVVDAVRDGEYSWQAHDVSVART